MEISEDNKTLRFYLRTAYAEKVPFRAEISVRYHVVSGSARIGEDLPPQTGVARFFYEHGSWRPYEPVTVEIYDDAHFEPDEQFSVFLSEPPEGFVISTNPIATVIIHDNDGPGQTALGANDAVLALAALPDGKVIAGGEFNSIDGVRRRGVARLYGDGGIDPAFDPGSGCDGSSPESRFMTMDGFSWAEPSPTSEEYPVTIWLACCKTVQWTQLSIRHSPDRLITEPFERSPCSATAK